ncbi:MAG: DUF4199 family protein [Bacteroidetes bacterium]|jgi:hypothetical protein|nr:DUF4199 family protein [Bacteroidota bacterium]
MPNRTQSVLIGGLVVGLLSTSVLGLINLFCCAGVIIGAVVGVWHYTDDHQITIPSGQGALIGALCGVVGAVIAGVLNQILIVIGLDFAQAMQESMMQNFGMSADQLEQMRQMQRGQQGGLLWIIGGTLFNMVLFAVFGAIGGAIGASVFQKGEGPPTGPPDGGGVATTP